MFLDTVLRRNRPLIDYSIAMHQQGLIEPDTFVVDMDVLIENAKLIIDAANKHSIGLYFMLKQLGRNPLIAKRLMELGYQGAVVVDFREAQVMMNNHIPIGNVGHLVQPPFGQLEQLIKYGVEVFTVYSLDKLKKINETANCLHKVQDVLV
ncbi:MAG: YhfX family PLP-dependent enzyme, partial [Erysipelothrix sp.]|nr:YhfX family PLP-dependent enzyme [Erysipelothrix sp.]